MRIVIPTIAVLICLSAAFTAAEEMPDSLNDLFSARWYEAEIIVFERLDVLDVNEDEQLTHYDRRSWPENLLLPFEGEWPQVSLDELEQPDGTPAPELRWADNGSEVCLGYPIIGELDPLHPDLIDHRFNQFNYDPFDDPNAELPLIDPQPEAPFEVVTDEPQDDADLEADPDVVSAVERDIFLAPPAPPSPLELMVEAVTDFENSLYNSSFRWLDRHTLTMINDVKAINRNRHLRPIWHGRWRQPVPPRDAPQPFYFSSAATQQGPLTLQGLAKVEGYLTLTVGRYLHFAPTLWYHADNLGMAPLALPTNVLPPQHTNSAPAFMELAESRRMRSTELHYLDHPKLGVIIRIDPIEPPEALVAQWQELQASQ